MLADSTGEGGEESPAAEVPAPSAAVLAEFEERENEYLEWLSSPEALSEREASQSAYGGLSAGEARDLLLEAFPEQLEALNADPARVLSELKVEQPLGTYAALVAGEGERSIVESSVPTESDIGGEGTQPVDLALEESGSDFVPQNPLTEVRLPGSAEGPIQLQSGLEVELPSDNDHSSQSMGDKNLFYPATEPATDTLVSPIAAGVEVFEQLRSPESPEQFRFVLDLPEGAELRETEAGVVEIISASEEKIGEVPPPSAVDAQGTVIPVTMHIEEESLLLEVPHRSRDLAYPVLLDPQFLEEGYVSYGNWAPSWNDAYGFSNTSSLSVTAKGGSYTYGANTHGQWVYTAPGQTTYVAAATFFSNTFNLPSNCGTEQPTNQPHGYAGLYNPSTGGYVGLGIWSGGSSYGPQYQTGWVGGSGVRQAMVGIGTTVSVHHKCAFTFSVGGVTIQEKDPEAPTIDWVSGTSTKWVKDLTVTAHASDPGLGVKAITLSPDGASPHTNDAGCSGTYTSRCQSSYQTSFGGGYFLEGERSANVSAYDPLGSSPDSDPKHVSSSFTLTTKIDRSLPEVELEGQFTEAIKEAESEGEVSKEEVPQLNLPVYNVKIEAEDGSKAEGKTKRSGVKNIAVFVDGKEMEVSWKAQECPTSSCKMTETYPLRLNGLEGGPIHHFKAVAEDQVGNKREREREFEYIPATGMKDEYVMQYFPLPDGQGDESEEEHPNRPELAVNVTNGNLVYRQMDVEVEGPAVDLEVERFYNSQQPEKDNTEWGDGWTLAQTPELEPEETKEKAPPVKASMRRTSGAVESSVGLPTESGATKFDKKLQAVVTKNPGGGYTVEDQSGETDTSLVFDKAGKVREETTSGYAKIDYSYEEGDLSELSVDDPASFGGVPKEPGPGELEAPAYLNSFGGSGSGAGQLSGPIGIARDPEGDVWVADTNHNRIQEFSPSGEFLREFGASGSGNGRFYVPRGVAIDPEGNVWVADTGHSRLQKFSPKGEYLTQLGTSGSGNGQFSWPRGVAVDPVGNIWVADTNNNRIQEFSAKGEFIRKFGSSGSGNSQFSYPGGIATDIEGHIWVADTENNRIQEFNSKGEFIRTFGSVGAKEGQLKSPQGLAFDPGGNLWVADGGNDRIQEFNSKGEYLAQFGTPGNNSGQLSSPQGIAADAKGNIWVADTANDRVQEFAASEFVRKFGGEGSEAGHLAGPIGVAADPKGNVWVADTKHSRIQEFGPSGEFVRQFGDKGTGNGQFSSPRGIATDSEGNVWVADTENNRLQEFTSKGEFIRTLGEKGSGNGQLSTPSGIVVDSAGNLWIADTGNTRIQELNAKGEFIRKFGTSGTGNGQFSLPRGIATDSEGNVWVADSNNNRIQEFNSKGEFIRKFGAVGSGNGQLDFPVGLTIDATGNLWVADSENTRIQEFNSKGEYLSQLEIPGKASISPFGPQGVAADAKGNIWVADTANDRVQEFAAGEFVRKFGGESSEGGHLASPYDVATDSEGNVWVADTNHNRIQEFDSSGEFMGQFDGCDLWGPRGIAVDPEGNVWVANSTSGYIQELGGDGTCLNQFGGFGKAEGKFGVLADLAIDPEGNIWTVDAGIQSLSPSRIQEFDPEGKFIRAFGKEGTGEGQLKSPQGIATDPEGNIWVADTGNDRIEEFSPEGEFIDAFGEKGTEDGQFSSPIGLAFAPSGQLWVTDSASDYAQEFTTEGEYLARFGSAGNEEGQLSQPRGITINFEGRIWIADTGNDRAQEWQIPSYAPKHSSIYLSSFGTEGTAAAKLRHPADVAVDSEGNLWVADETNQRIEEFDEAGEFILTFGKNVNKTAVEAGGNEVEKNLCTAASEDTCQVGTASSASGQMNRPVSLAIDAEGNIWVADKGNHRIEEFSPTGEYLGKFGSSGEGDGQLSEAEGIAIDHQGNIWVSDTYNGRVQEFSKTGEFIKVVGSYGTGEGEMGEPTGIDIGLGGNVWIADWQDNRVEEFNQTGEFVRQFGTYGTENGQFIHPDGLTIDDKGQLWVADEGNNRIQTFTGKGEYVAQFGTKGSGDGQFKFGWPLGIATDSKGKLWIADSRNNRVQRWGVYNYTPADEAWVVDSDPKVEIESTNGLVESVEGKQAGETTYTHKGELLSAVDGPQGETEYEYDSEGRMTKVTLPNGTWGKVAYGELDGRVKSVTVDPAGKEAAKTTYFAYQDSPSRRTTVSPEGEPATVYDIAADGSVLKWWNTKVPPEIENLFGSLFANRETAEAIKTGDYELLIQAYSVEGIASIEVIANGSDLVDEKTCDQEWKTPERECKTVEDPWVTNTGNWAPGILNLEVLVTDANGNVESAKFWVNIPYTPPPDPEADEPPTFDEVFRFREEFGLDLDLKGNEQAIDERIFNLIGDWYNPNTPEGEIARATYEQWGVPLRAVDAAELEYRDQYINADVSLIEEWTEANYPATYAGYHVDHRAGGILYIGFTQDQSTRLAEIKQQLPVLAANRLAVYPTAPVTSLLSLDATNETITENLESNAELASLITELEVDETANTVRVGSTDVGRMKSILTKLLGSQAPLEVTYEPSGMLATAGRNRTTGRMRAGDRIITETGACTAAFGATEDRKKKSNGEEIRAAFVLSAGHCAGLNEKVYRVSSNTNLENAQETSEIGVVSRNAIVPAKISTDGLAIRVKDSGIIPHGIYGSHGNLVSYDGATKARNSNEVCYSGARSNRVSCGPVVGRAMEILVEPDIGLAFAAGIYKVKFVHPVQSGDSGSPVWNRRTHAAIGVVSARKEGQAVSAVSPLLHPKRLSLKAVPGILHAPGMYSLHLSTTGN